MMATTAVLQIHTRAHFVQSDMIAHVTSMDTHVVRDLSPVFYFQRQNTSFDAALTFFTSHLFHAICIQRF